MTHPITQQEQDKPWQAYSISEVKQLLKNAAFPWWIAGGLAIELFVGRALRPHADIDVLLLRKDQILARKCLADWDCWVADPQGTLRIWRPAELLPATAHDVWCRESRQAPWRVQLMLDDGDDRYWRSRRCSFVTKPIGELGITSEVGVPVLAPEVQLFYKAKSPREKDHVDFMAALPLLSVKQKNWLSGAISVAYGTNNAWLNLIETAR